MNKDIKAKWIKALQSGKYKQGQDCLRQKNSFCPLGVLCDISKTAHWELDKYDVFSKWYYLDSSMELPIELRKLYRLTSEVKLNRINSMNDGEGKSFKEIADWIEKHL